LASRCPIRGSRIAGSGDRAEDGKGGQPLSGDLSISKNLGERVIQIYLTGGGKKPGGVNLPLVTNLLGGEGRKKERGKPIMSLGGNEVLLAC